MAGVSSVSHIPDDLIPSPIGIEAGASEVLDSLRVSRRTVRSPSGIWGGVVYGQSTPTTRASVVEVHSPVKYWG
jgi:hypothetical protein